MSKRTPSEKSSADLAAVYQALDRAQAIIEFDLEGNVLTANENFLDLFGYSLEEVVGRHHRMFCEPDYADSEEYAEFWALKWSDLLRNEEKVLDQQGVGRGLLPDGHPPLRGEGHGGPVR